MMTTQTATAPRPDVGVPAADDMPTPFSLDISSILALLSDDDALDDWFLRFTTDNEHLGYQFEIDRQGRLIAMASEGMAGAQWQFNLQFDLGIWADTGPGGQVVIGNALVRMPGFGRRAVVRAGLLPSSTRY